MIVLDTNVVSALMQTRPDERVVTWLDQQPSESVWTTAVTVFEIRFGLALLAPGRRRRQLEKAFTETLTDDLAGRVLPFDDEAAKEAASRAAVSRTKGRPVEFRDIEIAGIVASRRGTLATGNSRHFEGLSIGIVNPWH